MAKFLQNKFLPGAIALLLVCGFFVFGTNKALADVTGSLAPTGDGFYTAWHGSYTDVDEGTASPNLCGGQGADYIHEHESSYRNSFTLDISSVPNGATIQSVAITVVDRGGSEAGGTYQTFTRLDGTNQDSGVNLNATGSSGDLCSSPKTQTIDVPDTVKSGTTALQIGVLKTSANSHDVRVGAITAVITYLPPTSTIRVTKVTSPADDTTHFSITATSADGGTITAPASRSTLATDHYEEFTVTLGHHYTITEDTPAGWTSSSDCSNVAPVNGQTVTCTFTNIEHGSITVHKYVLGTDGQTDVADNSPFSVSLDGGTAKSFSEDSVAVFDDLYPLTYTITEIPNPKYEQVSITPDGSELPGAQVTVTPGDNIDVYITNKQKPATIRIIKDVVSPDGAEVADNHVFSVTLNNETKEVSEDSPAIFTINTPGDYSAVEAQDSDYGEISYDPASVSVDYGDYKTITITNKQKPGTLTVIKHVINHEGIGAADANDFSFSLDDGDTYTPFTAEEGSMTGQNIVDVAPGTYMVTENYLQGYAGTYNDSQDGDCGNINIASNGAATCTITNSDIPTGMGAITVRKSLPNDNGGTAKTTDFPLWIDADNFEVPMSVTSGEYNFLAPNTYTVSETNPGQITGYTQSISCTDGETTITNGTIALTAQTAWVCTITNDDQPGTLHVYKHVYNNDGGTKTASDFSFQVTHNQTTGEPVAFTECDGPTYGCKDLTLDAGTYSVTELADSGYETTYSQGSESDNCNDIVITNGGTAYCNITNDDKPAGLEIIKHTDGGDDGTFNFTVLDTNPDHEFSHDEALTTIDGSASTDGYIKLKAATYDVTESVPEGWTLSSVLCNYGETQSVGEPITNGKRLVIGNGDYLTCTFNNTRRVITYSWVTTDWGTCSAECGGGTKTRTVTCQSSDQQTVSDEFCTGDKPTASQECNTQSCGGGGGGGGTFTPSPCVSVEYYDWQTTCVNGLQFRDIKTLIPEGCQMTQAQRDAGQRPCGSTGGQVLGEKIVGELATGGICDDAPSIATGQVQSMLDLMKVKRNLLSEKNAQDRYIKKLLSLAKDKQLSQQNINALINYVAYSGPRSLYLGEGERAGVLHSYLAAFGHLPRTEDEWCDAVKIATGRWTVERSDGSEKYAQDAFKSQVYKRDPKMDDQADQNAVMVMSYGLRPTPRSMEKESLAAKIFKGILKRLPQGARDWDMVRAIAYSGVAQ